MKPCLCTHLLAALSAVVCIANSTAQTTAFTYQGRLLENGAPYSGSAEFQFTLWDATTAGTSVATNDPAQVLIPVTDGLFTADLEFGGHVFNDTKRFLQIEVRKTIGTFTTLSPRQPITPTPMAIHANTAAEALSVDVGTISNPSFIGTTVEIPLEFQVNSQRAMRIEPTGDSGYDLNGSPDGAINVILGSPSNSIAEGLAGATIGGGGATDTGSPESENRIGGNGDYATIGGGMSNHAEGFHTTVGGGLNNYAGGNWATVPGGQNNEAFGSFSFAAGLRAKANHRGAFVWSDSQGSDFTSTKNDEFAIDAVNGVRIHNQGTGATLLRLETERPWEFRQRSSGSSTALELVSLDSSGVANKNFVINTTGGGSVGIGTVAPSFKLHVNGSVAGVGTYNNLSDERYKKNIQPLANALDTITRLEGVGFDWRREEYPDLEFEQGRQLGFIAQDLQCVVPEAVSVSEDGTLHAAYAQIIPVLVEAIKEQNQRLKMENAELKARIDSLEKLVHSLVR